MAIQNFLSGGYYGKLGATVGQRWKNKRTIRTYVIPANPRTEVQQANRGKFANAVVFAQMGLQMNYYATVFEDPNFTRWNYRMKVARELKDKGMLDLDLIPLYPTSFVPPTLIQSIKISGVQGTKHITFAVEGLTSDVDRVLSLMFAIYDENDTFLGYKLYLGYYYASNPGFLEVDVDDISEINKHCYVRAVSNDDVDSVTDMIASPRLQVQTKEIDIRAFNTSIKEVQKSLAGITVIFNEVWKGDPTTNNISILASFVSNGKKTNAYVTDATLENNNGYCSVSIPFIVSDNQNLPAFPEGSEFLVNSVAYEGSTWQYTKENDTVAYNDTDLSRDFVSTISSVSRYGTTFTVAFDETLPTVTSNTIKLAIRAVKNGAWVEEEVTPASISLNEITFEQSGADNGNIYAFPDDSTIAISGTIIGNGVTYTPNTTTAQSVINDDLARTFKSNISSISKVETTYNIAFDETLPTVGTNNLRITIRAVKNGAWVEEEVTISNISNNIISFIPAETTVQQLYAFPEGSTIKVEGTIGNNGVTYTSSIQLAQKVSNDDLNRYFYSVISSVSRSGTTFSINFARELPTSTSNTLTIKIKAVKNGVWIEEEIVIASISGNVITFNQSGAANQDIYAFPEGSTITISGAIIGNGVTYRAGQMNAQSVSNTDLSRNIAFNPAWDAKSKSAISFTIPFGGTVASANSNMSMVCSGRFDKRDSITQAFSCVGNGSNLTFTCTGDFKNYPMSTSGDKITVPQLQFTCNGVTYKLAGGDVNLRNAIKTSNWLSNSSLTKRFTKDISGSSPFTLIALHVSISGLVMDTDPPEQLIWVTGIKLSSSYTLIPYAQQMYADIISTTNAELQITADFDEGDTNNKVTSDKAITYSDTNVSFEYKGITYKLPALPATVGGYQTI